MNQEIIRLGEEQPLIDNSEQLPTVKPQAIERILSGAKLETKEGLISFEELYPSVTKYDLKFALAKALIEDGRYGDKRFLVQKFIFLDSLGDPRAKELKDKLTILLLERGDIETTSKEAEEAHDEVLRVIDRKEYLRQLREVLPIHLMGVITNLEIFSHISDADKRERLRSWTTRALLRPYLGDLQVETPKGEIDLRNILMLIPDKIFTDTDKLASNVVKSYFINSSMGMFRDNEETGFTRLEEVISLEPSSIKRQFMEDIKKEFKEIRDIQIPQKFVNSVEGWFSESSPFPLFRQKYFVHKFLRTGRCFLNGDTGATKTACAYLAFETTGTQRVTIFGPAKARNTWPKEADKIFLESSRPSVFAVRTSKDLDSPKIENSKYVYISTELLGMAWGNPELFSKIKAVLLEKRKTDGIIFDESDDFSNESAGRTRMIMDLVRSISDNYSRDNLVNLPMLALTGTPIASSLEDLDVTLALLYPEKFSLPGEYQKDKYPFSILALRDPRIAFSLLFGEEIMIQWSLEDLFGEKTPRLRFGRETIPMNPSEKIIYEWIAGLPLGTLAKVRMLRSVLMNPELIKRTCKERSLIPEPFYNPEELGTRLQELHEAWLEWLIEHKSAEIPDEQFSADWIAKYGDYEFLIQCFFEERLVNGVESLIERYPFIFKDWQINERVSGKYAHLRSFLENRLDKNENGFNPKEKIFIVVPYHKRGITRWLDDSNVKPEDFEDNAWSLYEYIISEWLPSLPAGTAINIDGSRSFAARDREASLWRESGTRNVIVVASMDSVYESMDWATRNSEDNKNIEKINVIFLGWPWGWDEFKQMSGRFIRPGQTKPVNIQVYESENSIDQGFYNLVRMKYLLTQVALAGVELSDEDKEFFNRATQAKRILVAEPSVGQAFLRDVVMRLRGKGEAGIEQELSRKKGDESFFDLWAEFYFDEGRDEFRIVGNNAELVKNIIIKSQPRRVLSIGAGTCLFARKINQAGHTAEINNLDINGVALRVAKENFPAIGSILVEGASHLSARSQIYDVIDCSFMLPWTKLYDEEKTKTEINQNERVKIVSEMNRVLKFGAIAVLSFPESSFDTETFDRFTQTLKQNFGFDVLNPSGISYATDLKPAKRIGWVITLQKVGEPNLSGLKLENLAFLTDERVKVSKYKAKKDSKSGIVRVDYPIFSSTHFEIHNPLTGEKEAANTEDIVPYVSPRDIVNNIKTKLFQEQWQIWVTLRRRIQRDLERGYEESEEILAVILTRRKFSEASAWDIDILQKIINAEIRRIRRREKSTEGNGVDFN